MTKKYAPKPGAHINRKEAQVVGEAMEKLRQKLKKTDFTTAQFARFCANTNEPVHDIWKRHRDSEIARAGHTAAAYLMRSVILVPYSEKFVKTGPRAVVIMPLKDGDRNFEGTVYDTDRVKADVDLLDEFEGQFRTNVNGLLKEAVHILGVARTRQTVASLLAAL